MRVERHGTLGDVEVDVCRPCGVMWLDPGELDRLDDSIRSHLGHLQLDDVDLEELQDWAPGRCPRCGVASYRDVGGARLQVIAPVAEPDLLLEICPSCHGLLLEEGQLEAIRDLLFRLDSEETRDTVIWRKVTHKGKSGYVAGSKTTKQRR